MGRPSLHVVPSADEPIRPTKGQRFPVKIRPVGDDHWIVTLPCGSTRELHRDTKRPKWEQYHFAWNGACAKGFETLESAVRACADDCRLNFADLAYNDEPARRIARACEDNLDQFTKTLRQLLRERTGRDWSVTRGRGTAYSWVRITAPKKRLVQYGYLSVEDQIILSSVFGTPVGHQGESVRTERGVRGWYILKALGANTDGWDVAPPSWD